MNSDTKLVVQEMTEDEGAVTKCSGCGGYDIDASDDEANQRVYARITTLWKDGHHAFAGMSRKEVVAVVTEVLQELPSNCPSCSNL